MRRYKKITAIGLAALLGSMVCGCGDNKNDPPTESLTEPVVITRA